MAVPASAAEDGSSLRQALPQEARELLEDTPITGVDPRKTAGSLWSKGLQLLREGLQRAVRPAFLMAAVCLLLSLLESFSKTSGLTLPNRLPQLAGATAILLLAFGEQRSMAAQCRVVIEQLDRFTKLLITVFTGVSVAAGKPASAAASAGAAMLFSDGLFWLSQKLFLPMTTLFLLLTYGGSIAENGLLQKAAGLKLQRICPLHGHVWRRDLGVFLDKYQKWSTYTPEEKGVVIAYASIYGNTELACQALANALSEEGVRDVRMYDVSVTDSSEILSEAFRRSHLVLASVTFNGGLFPNMEKLLLELRSHGLKNRTVALMENGTWAPVSGRKMQELLSGMAVTVLDQKITLSSTLKQGQLAEIRTLAKTIADECSVYCRV